VPSALTLVVTASSPAAAGSSRPHRLLLLHRMIERILNNGIHPENSDSLNRKIRISNLIALLSVVTMATYTPFYFIYSQEAGIYTNTSFLLFSLFSFYLIRKRHYIPAFFLHSTAGYGYFIIGTLVYGIQTNLHFYMIVMCMIVTTLFDDRRVIRFYLAFAVSSFFGLIWWSHYYEPFVGMPPGMETMELIIGNVNLFLLFFIISLFILFFKNEMLRSQRRVLEQKSVIEEKNRDITDSITYAKRIQSALLPGRQNLANVFPGSFLYFRPKDIVSGDFYWLHDTGTEKFLAVGDCTGHGVPGALMSVLGINLLTEIVENKHVSDPAEILNELRSRILYAFDKEGKSSEYKDGMDIALIRIRENDRSFSYAAAHNPVYHISAEGLTELPANRQPVGYAHVQQPFSTQHGTYNTGDAFILLTDGFADQFGGPRGKKFLYRPFKELLARSLGLDPEVVLDEVLESWRGSLEQVDDICVVGLRY
jgi:phosphoserine phosphatase RsbU/P